MSKWSIMPYVYLTKDKQIGIIEIPSYSYKNCSLEEYKTDYPHMVLEPEHIDEYFIEQIKAYGILWIQYSSKWPNIILGNNTILVPTKKYIS